MCLSSECSYRCDFSVLPENVWNHQTDKVVTMRFYPVHRLVFSQSLISLDLIEDFLELSCRAKDEDKISPYKGNSILYFHLCPFSIHVLVDNLVKHAKLPCCCNVAQINLP